MEIGFKLKATCYTKYLLYHNKLIVAPNALAIRNDEFNILTFILTRILPKHMGNVVLGTRQRHTYSPHGGKQDDKWDKLECKATQYWYMPFLAASLWIQITFMKFDQKSKFENKSNQTKCM